MLALFKVIKNLFIYLFVQSVTFALLAIILVFHGPLENIKETWVLTAMTTMNHQYLAKWFVSEVEIAEIIKRNQAPISDEKANVSAIKIDSNNAGESIIPDDEYTNPNAEVVYNENGVKVESISNGKFKGYITTIKDPSRVKVGTTKNLGTSGEQLDDMVVRYGATIGINAGGFEDTGGHGNGGTPLGFVIEDGQTAYSQSAKDYPVIGFNKDNILIIGTYNQSEMNALTLRDAITFKPFLIMNGVPQITEGNGGWGLAPRTAIGQRKDGTVLMLTIDGRQTSSIGATLREVQDIMLQYGAYSCANLDGGASTQLVLNGKTINKPCSSSGSRNISTAFIVK